MGSSTGSNTAMLSRLAPTVQILALTLGRGMTMARLARVVEASSPPIAVKVWDIDTPREAAVDKLASDGRAEAGVAVITGTGAAALTRVEMVAFSSIAESVAETADWRTRLVDRPGTLCIGCPFSDVYAAVTRALPALRWPANTVW